MNVKSLSEYIDVIDEFIIAIENSRNINISYLTNDSRKIKPNSIFVAIKGALSDGHDYIDSAVAKGAEVVVYQDDVFEKQVGITYIKVSNSYHSYAALCECYFDFPARQMKLIGITGTNGKTSSAYILKRILDHAGHQCGLISTIDYVYGEIHEEASRTTPEAFELQRLFSEMRKYGCEYVVMEVSSHALDQARIGKATFAGALFTNLSGDHLDYHGSMEDYFWAKHKLFSDYLSDNAVIVVNGDDLYGQRLLNEFPDAISFSSENKGFCDIRNVTYHDHGSLINFSLDQHEFKLNISLVGDYNAYNIAGAMVLAYKLGIRLELIKEALEENISVPGRLECFVGADDLTVFVDYAHTDDALAKVLITLNKIKRERLIVVFGCGGDRDKTKRPRMGAAAAKFADLIILTNDNSRSENPLDIIADIRAGIPDDVIVYDVQDRYSAIETAVNVANRGDFILVAGKGHETYQEIQGNITEFDDRNVVKEILNRK